MPASPAMRFSPGREPRGDNHKRGRSLENGIVFKERDDDLALFNEVQSRERDDFLLQTNDDFEDTFVTKLRHFQDHKLGINNVARGESSDLLNTEEDKNDYEWLITPPDTPLFPSLDDEAPQVILPQRGRPRAQPISISRSSTMEKNQRSSRASPSPNRVSPSSRSRTPTFQPRNRTSSTPSPSPPPPLKQTPESKRPSYPSNKPSSPTSRRLSTGSTNPNSRFISPVKTTRPNSASPKIKSWQTNIPGFSKESPPNLRTSLADRPASYVRGSSPASRRQSSSPTPSRSIGSSHSNDRDRFSVYSKGSVASSGDDEIESQASVVADGSDRSSLKKDGGVRNSSNKVLFSQKVSRTVSSSSAPKRSFDLALRQMDHKRVPQNMFRPLLSSVPSTTFYPTKAGPTWTSSVTTSSNASSELNTSGAHDNEENALRHEEDDATSELYVQVPDYNIDNEVFVFEKTDSSNQDIIMGNETNDVDFTEVDCLKEMLVCLKCGCRYFVVGVMEDEVNLCVDCRKSSLRLTFSDGDCELTKLEVKSGELGSEIEVAHEEQEDLVKDGQLKSKQVNLQVISQHTGSEQIQQVDFPNSEVDLLEKEGVSMNEQMQHAVDFPNLKVDFPDSSVDFSDSNVEFTDLKVDYLERECISMNEQNQQAVDFPNPKVDSLGTEGISMVDQIHYTADSPNPKVDSLETEGISMVDQIHQAVDIPNSVDSIERESISVVDQIQHAIDFPNPKVDSLETENISTNKQTPHTVDFPNPKVDFSEKGLPIIIKSKHNMIKGPLFRSGTFSASSISYDDLSYARESTNSMKSSIGRGSMSPSSSVDYGRFNRQLSNSKKSENETYKYAADTKHQRSTSSFSATSSHAFHPSSITTSTTLDSFEKDVADMAKDVADVAPVDPQENGTCAENDDVSIRVESELPLGTDQAEDLGKDDGALVTHTIEEEGTSVDACMESNEVELGMIAEGEVDCAFSSSSDSECNVSEHLENSNALLEDTDVATTLVKDIETLATDCETSNHSSRIVEESTVLVGGTKGRSLTLEEATETILFCSSIVHNLAYQAANIALEKQTLPEPSGNTTNPSFPLIPTLTTPKEDPQNKNTKSKPKKTKQKKDTTKPANDSKTDDNDDEINSSKQPRIVYPSNNKENMKPPPKLESKCNCVIM